jgi:hypothetical protein
MAITVEELYKQAQVLPLAERRRLGQLLVTETPEKRQLAEKLRAARARIVASGDPLLDWQSLETELAERRGEQ